MSANEARAAELRAAAGELRRRATDLETTAGQLRRAVVGMTFAGPAAEELQVASQDHWRRLDQSASRVRHLADSFEREANTLPLDGL